jgi:type I site-specific restriction endonuclease
MIMFSASRSQGLRIAPLLCLLFLPAAAQPPAPDAAAKMAAWKKLETQNLPAIEKLGAANPCANQSAISARLEETRNAAREYFTVTSQRLQQSYDVTSKDVELLKKSWDEVKTRRGDLQAAVAAMESTLASYRSSAAALPANDEEGRLIYQRLVRSVEQSLNSLREAAADSQAADRFAQIAAEFLGNRLYGAEKERKLLDLDRQVTELKYDGLLQQSEVACAGQRAPEMIRQLDRAATTSAPDTLAGEWVFSGAADPTQPASIVLQVQVAGSRVDAVLRVTGIPRKWRLPVTLDLTVSGLKNGKLAWTAAGQAGALELIPTGQLLELVWKSQEGILFDGLLKRR